MLGAIIVLGTAQAATRPKALWVGGVDVIKQSTYAVPIESVVVDHQGPGGVSSMQFSVECTTVPPNITIGEGMDVRFFNTTKGWYDFSGFVDHVDIVNLDGNRGTVYQVQAIGFEAILDWSVMAADITVASGTRPDVAAQAVFANATGTSLGRINATSAGVTTSTDTNPVAANGVFSGTSVSLGVAVTITAGTTLREALRQVNAGMVWAAGNDLAEAFVSTIDFLGGLRFYGIGRQLFTSSWQVSPADWVFPVVDNDTPGAQPGENTSYGIDAAQARGVLVKGTGVTVYVSGSALEGPVAVLVDSTITTAAAAQAAGLNYLASGQSQARGSFEWQDRPPFAGQARPGGAVTITDARLGLAAITFLSSAVSKTYNPSGRENWTVSFGGLAPSVTALTRQLTRTTLS